MVSLFGTQPQHTPHPPANSRVPRLDHSQQSRKGVGPHLPDRLLSIFTRHITIRLTDRQKRFPIQVKPHTEPLPPLHWFAARINKPPNNLWTKQPDSKTKSDDSQARDQEPPPSPLPRRIPPSKFLLPLLAPPLLPPLFPLRKPRRNPTWPVARLFVPTIASRSIPPACNPIHTGNGDRKSVV